MKEINYWKKTRLLPANHCDFLLALYTNGEGAKNPAAVRGSNIFIFLLQLLILIVLVPFSFIVIYFTKFSIILQTSILIFLLMFAFISYLLMARRGNSLKILALSVLLMLLLICSVFFGDQFLNYSLTNKVVIMLNTVGWIVYASFKQIRYLKILGYLSLLGVIIYIVL